MPLLRFRATAACHEFAPMRDWLYPRGAGSELLVQLVSRGAAAMIVRILESPVEPDLAGR